MRNTFATRKKIILVDKECAHTIQAKTGLFI